MSLDRSLKMKGSLSRHRNVLTRAERIKMLQEQERFKKEAGMSKELAMQLLDALQRNEKEEQKKILAARQAKRKKTDKDW